MEFFGYRPAAILRGMFILTTGLAWQFGCSENTVTKTGNAPSPPTPPAVEVDPGPFPSNYKEVATNWVHEQQKLGNIPPGILTAMPEPVKSQTPPGWTLLVHVLAIVNPSGSDPSQATSQLEYRVTVRDGKVVNQIAPSPTKLPVTFTPGVPFPVQ
jgi:hypothetical protein